MSDAIETVAMKIAVEMEIHAALGTKTNAKAKVILPYLRAYGDQREREALERSAKMIAEEREIAQRRFGSRHDKPCRRLKILTCALWECQQANECQHGA